MGEKFISDYYNRYHPFDQGKTIALEDRIIFNLDESGEYKLQGYIDRLTETKDGHYQIHDYKTNSRLPMPDYIQQDRQLALYSIGVQERYPAATNIRLIWHFLAFDKEIDSTRTVKELDELKKNTIQLIDEIEREYKRNKPVHGYPRDQTEKRDHKKINNFIGVTVSTFIFSLIGLIPQFAPYVNG